MLYFESPSGGEVTNCNRYRTHEGILFCFACTCESLLSDGSHRKVTCWLVKEEVISPNQSQLCGSSRIYSTSSEIIIVMSWVLCDISMGFINSLSFFVWFGRQEGGKEIVITYVDTAWDWISLILLWPLVRILQCISMD